MALAKHIQIAQTQGPKAGFNAYVESLDRSGLDTAQAALAEIRSKGNKKAQFEFYCAKFGSKFGATPQRVDEADELAQQLAVLQARLAELQQQGIGVIAPVVEGPEGVFTSGEEEDTSLDDVEDSWTQEDTDDEQSLAKRVARMFGHSKPTEVTMEEVAATQAPKPTRSSRSTTRTNGAKVENKENLWRPWAVARFGIPTQVGGTFTYKSKRASKNTVHQVTRVTKDGVYAKRIK